MMAEEEKNEDSENENIVEQDEIDWGWAGIFPLGKLYLFIKSCHE